MAVEQVRGTIGRRVVIADAGPPIAAARPLLEGLERSGYYLGRPEIEAVLAALAE